MIEVDHLVTIATFDPNIHLTFILLLDDLEPTPGEFNIQPQSHNTCVFPHIPPHAPRLYSNCRREKNWRGNNDLRWLNL